MAAPRGALMVALSFLTPDSAADPTIGQGRVYLFRGSKLSPLL